MPWAKLDDQYFFHPKVIAAGRDPRDVHLASVGYCAGQLTDGFIPEAALPLIGAMAMVDNVHECADRLVEVDLWERVEGGYQVHDYLDYNPSGAQVKAQRKINAQRQAEWREHHRNGGGCYQARDVDEHNDITNDVSNAVSASVVPSAPFPSPSPILHTEDSMQGASAPRPVAEPEKPKRKTARGDERTKHPAIQCVKGILNGKLPPLELYDDILAILGDRPDGPLLAACRKEWMRRGYNGNGYGWLTDWYAQGGPEPRGASAQPRASPEAADPWGPGGLRWSSELTGETGVIGGKSNGK